MPTGLEGNGVPLLRERAVAASVQRALECLYQLDRAADVEHFMEEAARDEREALLVKQAADGAVEMALRVAPLARREFDLATDKDLDPLCQLIEGVSHFVYLADRATRDRATTQLELEVQAEVDKYVVLVASVSGGAQTAGHEAPAASARLRERLFSRVSFLHDVASEEGRRYRLANDAAQRFTGRLEREFLARNRYGEMRAELRRFFQMGQEDKLRATRV